MAKQPVKDWTKDYDIFSMEYVKDPFPIWDELREKCPVAHTERWGGSWMPTKYEDLLNIAQDIQHYSSRDVLVAPTRWPAGRRYRRRGAAPLRALPNAGGAPPITSDPPMHTWARKLLLPLFSVSADRRSTSPRRASSAGSLIEGFVAQRPRDGAVDYAQQIPPRVIASMLGIPEDMAGEFTEWVRGFLELGLKNPELRQQSARSIFELPHERIQDHKVNPGDDDLITTCSTRKVDGEPVPDVHILGTCFLIMVAGIDTTWSSIGSALWHLAQNPGDRQRINETRTSSRSPSRSFCARTRL